MSDSPPSPPAPSSLADASRATDRRLDAVVLGAGVAGSATARALADRGLETVVVEAATGAGTGASGRSAEMIRRHSTDPVTAEWLRRGARHHAEGPHGRFRRTGSLLIGRGDEDVSRHLPYAEGRALWTPDDGVADAAALVESWLEGLPVLYGERAVRVDPDDQGLRLTTTAERVLRARVVVNATGAWAGRLPGLELPLRPLLRHLFVTPDRDVDPDAPWLWDDFAGYYVRPSGPRLLLCCCDEEETTPGDVATRDGVASRALETFRRHQPGLEPLAISSGWAGQRTFADDRRFVVGFDPRRRGVLHVAGLGGHGITASPALGELAAELAAAGPDVEPPPLAAPLAPARLLA